MPVPAASTRPSEEVLTSQAAVALWLRFQCNPAATLHDSYRERLVREAKVGVEANKRQPSQKMLQEISKEPPKESPKEPLWLKSLWRTAFLSRLVCERFALRCDAWPHVPSELSFFLRLVMLDTKVLLPLLRSVGLVLSAHEIAAIIDREEVACIKQGLGEEDYAFAMGAGADLRPDPRRVVLRLQKKHRANLGDAAFHTVVGLRLLLLQGEGSLTEQHWRRLALKCPRGLVDLLRQSGGGGDAREIDEAEEGKGAEGLDEGTAAGLQAQLALFASDEQASPSEVETFWCQVAKEVVGSWHDWLESSKVA